MSPIAAQLMLISAPPPMPWIARKATSCAIDCDAPASSEATVNATMPVNSTGRLPITSLIRP